MDCPNCTITRYSKAAGEERTFSPSISKKGDGVCQYCGYELPLINGVLDRLPDRPLTDEDVEQIENIIGVVGVDKNERHVPALRPRTVYGLVKDERFLENQRVRVGLLDETVTYVWKDVEIEEKDDGEIWRRGGWREADRINTHYWRDPVPYALNEASHDEDGDSAAPGPDQVGNDPWN